MTAKTRFEEETRGQIAFRRLAPDDFVQAMRRRLAALPTGAVERGRAILEILREDDAQLAAELFGVAPIPESEVERYAFHEGDLVLAAMARRVLAQAFVAARGMRHAADSAGYREAIDMAGLAPRVQNFGYYLREGWRLKEQEVASIARERLDASRVKRLVLPGAMGGSAIGAGVVRMLLANQGFQAEIEVLPHYPDPARPLRPSDLAAIYAYSGNNEEQLLWMAPAEAAGAQVVGFAVGGRLEEMCRERNHPFVVIPGETFGLVQPREHLPVAIALLLQLAGHLGIAWREEGGRRVAFNLDEWRPKIERVSHKLTELANEAYNVGLPIEKSIAKQAALFLNWGTTDPGRVANILKTHDPVIWASALYEPIAKRMENQFGECVEHPAPAKIMPEDMHNEQEAYVGQWMESLWRLGEAAGVESLAHNAVFLRFAAPRDGRLGARADKLFNGLFAGAPRMTFEIQDYGPDYPMLGELEALMFADLTRACAAILRGVTPHYVHSMNYVKHYMATLPGSPGTTGTY